MGRGSVTSTNKFDRMKVFYDKFGKKWKEKVQPDNTTYWIREFSKFAITDAFGNIRDPFMEEKIDRIQKYAVAISTSRNDSFEVHCSDCGVCLYREALSLVTLNQFEGLKCPHPRNCK